MNSPHAGERERNVFEALTREHLPRLYAFALRLTGERAAAEDLVQETHVKAYQAFHQFVLGREACPWLMKILLNTYCDQVRHECRAPAPLQPEDLDAWYQASRQAHTSHLRTYGPHDALTLPSLAPHAKGGYCAKAAIHSSRIRHTSSKLCP